MAEELGKIEKPSVDSFKKGRKLYFIPVIYQGESMPVEYCQKCDKYWEQVKKHLAELDAKLGEAKKIYHELVALSGEEGVASVKALNTGSHEIITSYLQKSAQFEALEDADILTEYMDWSRCLMAGLENQKVVSQIYESYVTTGKKRNEYLTRKIDETLKENEIGIVLMRENHQVQFPSDIQVFYISPPALDEIKRWLREYEGKAGKEPDKEPDKKPEQE